MTGASASVTAPMGKGAGCAAHRPASNVGQKHVQKDRAYHDLPRVLVTVLSARNNMDSWDILPSRLPCLYQSVDLLAKL